MGISDYHLAVGCVPHLCDDAQARRWLSPDLIQDAPAGPRRADWLAARVLLARLLNDGRLPKLARSAGGKPWHPALPAFNISNSAARVAVLVGDRDVGCDLEQLRPRARFMAIARHSFHPTLCDWLQSLPESQQLTQFWRIWTAHEAVLKQRGGSVWQMSQLELALPTLCPPDRFLHHLTLGESLIACCGESPFPDDFSARLVVC